MSSITNEIFHAWYLSADPNPDGNIMQLRMDAMKQNLNKNKIGFWQDLIRLYLGIPVEDKGNLDKLIEIFRSSDNTFPSINNENLIRCLASIMLCFKLEIYNTRQNNIVSLAVINSNLLGQYQLYDSIPLISFAKQYLSNSAILERELKPDDIIANLGNIPGTLKDDSIPSANKAITSLVNELKIVLHSNKALAEESNVLWWLFGEYSSINDSSFKSAGALNMIVIAAKELSTLTAFNNGFYSAEHILNKAIHISGNVKSKQISLYEAVNSLPVKIRNEIVNETKLKLNEFTPCLNAIAKSLDNQDNIDWSNYYKTQYFNADVKRKLTYLELSTQFYREFIYLKN